MNKEITIKILSELIELKSQFDNKDREMTFRITAHPHLYVNVYPYSENPFLKVDLRRITEEECEEAIQKVKDLI